MRILLTIAFIRFAKIDFAIGNDLLEMKDVWHSDCEIACYVNRACKGYQYEYDNKTCWLKDNFEEIEQVYVKSVAGIKVQKGTTIVIIPPEN